MSSNYTEEERTIEKKASKIYGLNHEPNPNKTSKVKEDNLLNTIEYHEKLSKGWKKSVTDIYEKDVNRKPFIRDSFSEKVQIICESTRKRKTENLPKELQKFIRREYNNDFIKWDTTIRCFDDFQLEKRKDEFVECPWINYFLGDLKYRASNAVRDQLAFLEKKTKIQEIKIEPRERKQIINMIKRSYESGEHQESYYLSNEYLYSLQEIFFEDKESLRQCIDIALGRGIDRNISLDDDSIKIDREDERSKSDGIIESENSKEQIYNLVIKFSSILERSDGKKKLREDRKDWYKKIMIWYLSRDISEDIINYLQEQGVEWIDFNLLREMKEANIKKQNEFAAFLHKDKSKVTTYLKDFIIYFEELKNSLK